MLRGVGCVSITPGGPLTLKDHTRASSLGWAALPCSVLTSYNLGKSEMGTTQATWPSGCGMS